MKRIRSALARTLDRPAVIAVPPQMDKVRKLERWYARVVLFAFAALAIAILAA